jgi:hypothetical protein
MEKFFNPAVALMNRLKYPQKFILVSLLFVLPLALAILLLIPSINERIDFAQQEKYGNEYLHSLRQLLGHSLQNKALAHNYLSGNNSLKAQLLSNQARIDEDIKTLETINQELGDTLKTADSFKALQGGWQELKNQTLTLEVSASDERHSEFIAAVRGLISLVGNTSKLILDPDLDSYYLMDVLLLKLPENQNLVAQTKFLGEQVIAQKRLIGVEREQLILLTGLIKSNLETTQNSLGFAFRNNPAQNLEPNLTGRLLEFNVANEAFLETLRRELITPPTINPQSAGAMYSDLASQALTASFKLWDQAAVELDGLLQDPDRQLYPAQIPGRSCHGAGPGLLFMGRVLFGRYADRFQPGCCGQRYGQQQPEPDR